jgi:GPH family glycoside/pentoside/hexuronide:cation symporter
MVVGYWVHFKVTDGYETIENVAAPSKSKANAGDMLKGLFQNPNLLLLLVADLSKWVVKFVVGASAVYYFRYAVNMPTLVVQYVLFAGVAAVIGAYFARYLAKSLSNRVTVIVSYAVMSIAMFIAYFMYSSVWVVFSLMLLAQVGYGICYACAPALYADTAVYAEWKTGKSNVGWIMGLQTVPLKVGVILRGIVVAASLAAANFDAKIDPAKASVELQKGVTAAFALWPAIFVAAGFLILLLGYRLNKETVEKYQAEINARS